jgi:hypothetical protein
MEYYLFPLQIKQKNVGWRLQEEMNSLICHVKILKSSPDLSLRSELLYFIDYYSDIHRKMLDKDEKILSFLKHFASPLHNGRYD